MKRRPQTPTDSDRSHGDRDSANFRTPVSKYKRPNPNNLSVNSISGTEVLSTAKVNPFEKHILANLHRPFWSPTIFKPNSELMETPPQTDWAIDQISKLYPKAIEDSPSTHQNELELTPSSEAKAQADIELFFSQSCVLPSPTVPFINPNNSTNTLMGAMEISRSSPLPSINIHLISQNSQSENLAINATQNSTTSKTMKDSWTSTLLSLPPQLPPHIEFLLQPYLKCLNDENLSSSTCAVNVSCASKSSLDSTTSNRKTAILAPCLSLNTSNNGSNSRRRRLAFSSTDEDEDENRRSCSQLDFSYEEFSPSPMQINASSPMHMMSPSKFHCSPSPYCPKDGFHIRRSEDTPCSSSRTNNLQSPNLTPIRRPYAANKSATAKMLDLSQD